MQDFLGIVNAKRMIYYGVHVDKYVTACIIM